MSPQQSSTKDDSQSMQRSQLDIENVCEQKPDSATSHSRSIIPWHDLATIFRLLRKIVAMPFNTSLFYIKLSGIEQNSSEKLTVIYIGDRSSYEYLISNLFTVDPEVCEQRRIPWWEVNRQLTIARDHADLLIGDIDFPLDSMIKKQGILVSPRWLKQKVLIADKWKDVLANLRRKTRREALRSIRKHQLTARVVRDVDSDRYFYHQLYKPYIHRRYGAQATVVDEPRFLSECANGQLIQILHGNKILGVVLVHVTGKQLTIAWTGIDKEVTGSQFNGVADALDLYSLMFAYTQSCDVMDMGGSRPLINDGVLRYKRKWGAAVSQGLIPKGSIFYIPCRMTRPVEKFLENNPMIICQGKKLLCHSWIFTTESNVTNTDDRETLSAHFDRMYQPGLDGFQCFQVDDKGSQAGFTDTFADLPCRIKYISRSKVVSALPAKQS